MSTKIIKFNFRHTYWCSISMKKAILLLALVIGITSKSYNALYITGQEYLIYRKVINNSFTVGEKLTYRLHYGIIDAGEAVLEVKESKIKAKGRDLYRIVGTGRSIKAFDLEDDSLLEDKLKNLLDYYNFQIENIHKAEKFYYQEVFDNLKET